MRRKEFTSRHEMTDKTLHLRDDTSKLKVYDEAKNDSGLLTCGVNSQIPLKATLEDKKESRASLHVIEVDPGRTLNPQTPLGLTEPASGISPANVVSHILDPDGRSVNDREEGLHKKKFSNRHRECCRVSY